MTDLRKVAQQALEALEPYADIKPRDWKTDREKLWRAYDALRAALAQPQCNPHPDAPHGFDRNGSHSADRYVCTCEGWVPDVPEGWVLVPVATLDDWRQRVNTLATLSTKSERYEIGIALKQAIRDAAAPAPGETK